MSLFGSAGDGGAAKLEKARQASITQGQQGIDAQFSGFDPAFYNKAKTDYTAATTPGMLSDFRATKNNLTYALARGGNMKGSVAVQQNNSLNSKLAQNESQIANNAQGASNDLMARVNTQKGQLTEQLNSSADPASVATQATAATSQLRAPSAIQPLGNLFADWSSQYLNKQNGTNTSPNIWSQLLNNGVGTVT
ncbi:MAG: hypothetical protein WCS42_09960 [Verrucomicrobiota bacterium]